MDNTSEKKDKRTLVLYLKDEELWQLRRLAYRMKMNEYDCLKYCLRLVNWWSRGEIEP